MMRLLAIILVFLTTSALAQQRAPSRSPGLLCVYGTMLTIHSWSETCTPESKSEIAELQEILGTIRDDISRHEDWTTERIDAFEAENGAEAGPDLCQNQDMVMLSSVLLTSLDRVRGQIEPLLNQPSQPEWGDCR